MTRILLVEDNPGDARLLVELFQEVSGQFAIEQAPTLSEAIARVPDCDVVLLDLSLPDAFGLETARRMVDAAPSVPVVILTGTTDEDLATRSVQLGAQDYLVKGEITPSLLSRTIRYAIERKKAEGDARRLLAAQLAQARSEEEARRAHFVAEAGAILSTSLDVEETARRLAEVVVPTVATACAIDAFDEGGALVPLAYADSAGGVRPVNEESANCAREAITKRATTRRASATGGEIACVPMIVRDAPIGVISFAFAADRAEHLHDDLLLAEDLARRASVALSNARLYLEARRAIAARDEILAIVSHDLRNPLNVIAIVLQSLRQPRTTELAKVDLLDRAARAQERIRSLLDDLLDVAKIDQRTLHIDPRVLELGPAIAELVELERPVAAQRQVRIEADLPRGVFALADRVRLGQVVANLVGNAIKFTPAGGAIHVVLERVGSFASVVVCDTGRGIAPADLPRIFDRFYQARESRKEGAGLGLAIAKGIVEAHGGTISATNGEGGGACFRFTLPLASAPVDAPREVPNVASA